MNTADIVRMANQIAEFFSAYPEDEGVEGTAKHIVDFWDPRMRAQLDAIVHAGGEGLSPLALKAARQIVSETTKPETARETAGT